MTKHNGKISFDYYRGTRMVYAPAVKWYNFAGLPYGSEMERVLEPARNEEEDAVVVAPDKYTAMLLKLESYGRNIPVILGEKQAIRLVDERCTGLNGNGNGHF
ncbi:hypothetical protein JW859_09735 [bacterium]|nr:hypothetical protein [bacterium]